MKFLARLKELIGEDAFKKIEPEIKGKELYLLDEKDYLPKEKANELRNEVKTLTADKVKLSTDLEKANKDLEDIKKNADDGKKTVEEQIKSLTDEIKALKDSGNQKDADLAKEKKLSILKDHLNKSKVNATYLKQAVGEFKLDDLEIDDDGNITGWDDKVKGVQDKYPAFFGENKLSGNDTSSGDGSDPIKEQTTEEFLTDVFDGKAE